MFRNFAILIISHGRCNECYKKTYHTLMRIGCKSKIFILCSDDDNTIPEYKKIFGNENVIIFNKEDCARRYNIDFIDSWHTDKNLQKSPIWARNIQFEIARKLGYRYFIVLDDDYNELRFKKKIISPKNNKPSLWSRFLQPSDDFDEICEHYFKVLDSAPFLQSVGFCQIGDLMGGLDSEVIKTGFLYKVMNWWFLDTEKAFRYYGRLNDDVNTYCLHNKHGQLFLTLGNIALRQDLTQLNNGGLTDLYKTFGTWVKSMYSVVCCPSTVSIGTLGIEYKNFRIHHHINSKSSHPVIISDKYCKGNHLDYDSQVMKEKVVMKDNCIEEIKKYTFIDKECEVLENVCLSEDISDLF